MKYEGRFFCRAALGCGALCACLAIQSAAIAQITEAELAALAFDDMVEATDESTQDVSEAGNARYFARAALVIQWLKQQTLSQLSKSQLLWCVMHARPHRRSASQGFEVTWTGQVTAPRDGQYVFSISPLKTSTEDGNTYYRQWMKVEINGEAVVDAMPEAWNWQGQPIALQASATAPLRVTFRYEINAPWRLAPAILFWQGPGLSRSVVPASALSQEAGGGPGLAAEYRWTEEDGESGQSIEHVHTVVDPEIDFAWTEAGLASNDLVTLRAATSALFERTTAGSLLEEYASSGTKDNQPHPLFREGSEQYRRALAYSKTAERLAWIERLAAHPEVLSAAPLNQLWKFFCSIRPGCEDEALALLGVWLEGHGDLAPSLAPSAKAFYSQNRVLYRAVAIALAAEHPPSFAALEEEYLESPDGRCCLSTAYVLAYGHLMQGTIETWIEQLKEKLDDETIVGDARVNWLLARAMAEEIRRGPADRHMAAPERLLDGWQWLDEASLVVESPEIRLRIYREKVARMQAMHQWSGLESQLGFARTELEGVVGAAQQLAAWTESMSQARQLAVAEAEQAADQQRASYIAELTQRRDKASESGDEAAVSRYEQLISSVQAANSEP